MTDKTEKIEEQEGIAGNIKELKKKEDEVSKEETELKSSRSDYFVPALIFPSYYKPLEILRLSV